jgi:hypothetical protein
MLLLIGKEAFNMTCCEFETKTTKDAHSRHYYGNVLIAAKVKCCPKGIDKVLGCV